MIRPWIVVQRSTERRQVEVRIASLNPLVDRLFTLYAEYVADCPDVEVLLTLIAACRLMPFNERPPPSASREKVQAESKPQISQRRPHRLRVPRRTPAPRRKLQFQRPTGNRQWKTTRNKVTHRTDSLTTLGIEVATAASREASYRELCLGCRKSSRRQNAHPPNLRGISLVKSRPPPPRTMVPITANIC